MDFLRFFAFFCDFLRFFAIFLRFFAIFCDFLRFFRKKSQKIAKNRKTKPFSNPSNPWNQSILETEIDGVDGAVQLIFS